MARKPTERVKRIGRFLIAKELSRSEFENRLLRLPAGHIVIAERRDRNDGRFRYNAEYLVEGPWMPPCEPGEEPKEVALRIEDLEGGAAELITSLSGDLQDRMPVVPEPSEALDGRLLQFIPRSEESLFVLCTRSLMSEQQRDRLHQFFLRAFENAPIKPRVLVMESPCRVHAVHDIEVIDHGNRHLVQSDGA
jgi:hypothetical protein